MGEHPFHFVCINAHTDSQISASIFYAILQLATRTLDRDPQHGHTFYVLRFGNGTYNPHRDAKHLDAINPIRRDTSTIPAGGWTVIRNNLTFSRNGSKLGFMYFKTLYSPLKYSQWHMEVGLLVQFVELPSKIYDLKLPQSALDLCKFDYMHARKKALD
ncbi:hypothetical protein BC936DRAFT_142739 [Jimgerdemannia flammicorona]|uniref:Plastocyanin-like domain-containing protein n=1 Tax=Jimgerdemannia flammicorona TaxID=994334 RepID=A0A433DET0_9FUNG|nr:hypothetical protein BC936DRAFT_142739 [Jimgerdemannia flammicorona]